MLLTRQQAKAQKRNAKRLGQILLDARIELDHRLAYLEETAIYHGDWELATLSDSQEVYAVIGELLTIAEKLSESNHFEIEDKLSQVEDKFYSY
ncbi:MAG: hypothetical protein EBE86_013110 [Hormoscilla sp. GUM202]|nr:hypothetical protein [Hormoscilla sp. GUM202]